MDCRNAALDEISIHAPRTGSDRYSFLAARRHSSISIHAPRTGSDGSIAAKDFVDAISIHAPRTGSDVMAQMRAFRDLRFQSTLPARGATPNLRWWKSAYKISIHAPRTGSDERKNAIWDELCNFNPRSPHGERRACSARKQAIGYHFNPRSPHGERRDGANACIPRLAISIHAPRTGSDAFINKE